MELTRNEKYLIIEALEFVLGYQEGEAAEETEELIKKLEKGGR